MCFQPFCTSSLEKYLFRSPVQFFDSVVCFFDIELYELLYILEINRLSIASFADIFPHSVGCYFILFMLSFAVKKILSFIRSHLFLFPLL